LGFILLKHSALNVYPKKQQLISQYFYIFVQLNKH
jgi:hypothetical protein